MVLGRRHSGTPELTADKLKTIRSRFQRRSTGQLPNLSADCRTHPDSVLAQLGVAYDTAFALGSIPKEERPEAVRKARLAADDALGWRQTSATRYVPWCLLRPPTHSRECEDRMRAGMKADPDAPFVPVFLSSLLYSMGRFEELSQFARAGLAADPFHPQKLRRVVRTLILEGQKDEAEGLFAKAMRWWPATWRTLLGPPQCLRHARRSRQCGTGAHPACRHPILENPRVQIIVDADRLPSKGRSSACGLMSRSGRRTIC